MGVVLMRPNQGFLDRLAAADRVWQREKARVFWWRAIPWLLGFALVAFGVDAFMQLSRPARLIWLAAGGSAGAATFAFGCYFGWVRRNPAERTARHLENREPRLGSKLINTLQLARLTENKDFPAPTRGIAAQAVVRYGEQLAGTDFSKLALTGESRRRLKHAGLAALAFCLLLAAFYPVASIVLPRFLDPLGDHPPYAFTRIDIVDPGERGADVVYGGSLPVRVKWSGHEPHELFLSVYPRDGSSQPVTLPMIRDGENGFVQEVGDVRSDFFIVAHSKTNSFYSRTREARVLLTPRIENAFLQITPPAYTGLKTEERPFPFKSANALEGSLLRFRLLSNRPLKSGSMEITRNGKTETIPLTPHGEKEVSGSFKVDDDAKLRFRVTDIDGIPSDQQPEALISVLHDLPPTVSIVAPEQDGFAALNYKLTAKIEASDDYGVKTLRIQRALNGAYSVPRVVNIPDVERDVAQNLLFDFSDLGVKPGDRVSLFAEAIDTAPNPHLARSQTITLTMISEADYNDFIRQQNDVRDLSDKYDQLLQQFDALRDQQEQLAKDAAALRDKARDDKAAAAHLADFDQLTARQNELNQRLNDQAGRMEKFVRPNPVYDFERDLQKQLASEAQDIRQSTDVNNTSLNQLAKETSNPDGSRSLTPGNIGQLQSEAKDQAQRLGARDQEMAQSITKPLEDLSQFHDLVNDFNEFEQLYHAQQALSEQTRAYQNKGPLSREDQLALKDLAAQQDAIRGALAQLPGALREHAKAAQGKFPKAADSGQQLADAMENGRFEQLASSATGKMLDGDGEQGALLSQRLESEMRNLFGQCKGSGQGSSDELDQYIKLNLGGDSGQSFAQMRRCLKAGPNPGRFPGMGRGEGQGDESGYSMSAAPDVSVLGNEQFNPKGPRQNSKMSGNGAQATGLPASGLAAPQMDSPDVLKGLNPADRQSGPVHSEGAIEQYRSIVDEYFKSITHHP
jgi:hypothetical protein